MYTPSCLLFSCVLKYDHTLFVELKSSTTLDLRSPKVLPSFLVWVMLEKMPRETPSGMLAKELIYSALSSPLPMPWPALPGTSKYEVLCGGELTFKTSVWLKRYVYFRAPRGNIALYSTYAVSAFWHGFYPGTIYLHSFSNRSKVTTSSSLPSRLQRMYTGEFNFSSAPSLTGLDLGKFTTCSALL
jgi:hypothetical protein